MPLSTSSASIDQPWARSANEVLEALETAPEKGLDEAQVKQRRQMVGPNRLREARHPSAWQILINQFKSLIVLLLAAAAIASFAFGEIVEGMAVVAVIAINAAIGFVTELRAVRSMEALRELGSVKSQVRRSGKVQEVDAEALVPGDIVIIGGGDVVTADLRLVEASKLQADESALTGESVPVSKQLEPLQEDEPLAERTNMLFKGTAVTRGAGEGVVVATGMNTELGHISSLVEEAEEQVTPLEKRLDQLGRKLVWITLAIAVVLVATGLLAGKDPLLIIETAIALAVATVPEGLPIVATVALARGMWRMAQRNALINRLSAVETLGATDVICTDKTGTLTENQMTVTEIWLETGAVQVSGEGLELKGKFRRGDQELAPESEPALRDLLEIGVLCNNATLDRNESVRAEGAMGEPMEIALLVAGAKAGLQRSELISQEPESREIAFDPDLKMMATYHELNGGYRVAVKGAPEVTLEACRAVQGGDTPQSLDESQRDAWQAKSREMAEAGLRILALAEKRVDSVEAEPYHDLTLLGLIGLIDPPREEVRPAIRSCKEAGVRIVMVTGDHPVTARKIALAVDLVETDQVAVLEGKDIKPPEEASQEEQRRICEAQILARVSPEQKLDLISIHQKAGSIVAMTGDGVNDAPALKKADIGVAMGRRGTQVAKEAADMVLKDDAFSTIVLAVEQGRVIFENIRKFVLYLLSCNASEILVVSLASLASVPLPIRPLQILFLNLVTDVFPALALGVGQGDERIMEHPPRDPDESILTRRHWQAIAGYGSLITVAVLGVFGLALVWLDADTNKAVTISFLTLAFAQLWHVFNMQESGSGLLRNEITTNPYVWGALLLCTALLIAAVYLPVLSDVLKTVNPGLNGWLLVAGASLVPLLIGQIVKAMKPGTAN